ncbi:MAG: DUF4062 domain-containing protein [Pirellulaceae bacterium]|nr:DUF4062 domain-containing protein [Pirellulaceae bacterium]
MNGGQPAIRGYLAQTLIALLEALDDDQQWTSVTLEPNVDSHKVDILWQYPDRAKAVQVKSSQNPFAEADVKRWAGELEAWKQADEYELALIGTPGSPAVAKLRRVGKVAVPRAKNLDLDDFKERAAHRLDRFLEARDLFRGTADYREMVAGALADHLANLATRGEPLTPDDLAQLLTDWLPRAHASPADHPPSADADRAVRVFISSTAEDLAAHREAARDAAIGAGMLPIMMEYFVASGEHPPLEACLGKVSEADLLVVVVAHRYGWVPPDQGADPPKSITWLECEQAASEGKEVRRPGGSHSAAVAGPRRPGAGTR